ncbi:hypothetical protein [Mycobacterium paragordonae]|uniref:hypothetical protein n=1 Tax=Mycobacterium paragordonae TaxID=1389713 RepID=UPI0012E1B0AF|nr:hypothetical protein [Mycobacterium paragordonae]
MPPPGGTPNLPAARRADACVHAEAHRARGCADARPPQLLPQCLSEAWWPYSRACAAALCAGRPPRPINDYGPVLEPGEHALLSTEIGYSRYCDTEARYSPFSLIVAGRPALMFGALAVQGAINHRRKANVERKALHQSRFHQTSSVMVTTDRLICSTAPHGQMSFWFDSCTEFHPDLHQWTLTLGFEEAAPVRLHGPAAPALSLWSAHGVLGDRGLSDPRLAALLS